MRLLVLTALLAGSAGPPPPPLPPPSAATYVGRASCAECHGPEHDAWIDSHHDLAMQEATEATVLGDFDDAEHTHFGVTSTFTRRNGRFVVRTEGPDGAMGDYEVAWVFGVTPLQQYLVAFPAGRYQMLPLCWDTRPAADGGQRWFHLYPDEAVPPDDVLHWTGINQNWNYQCAECHSTDLRKGYDPATDTYATTWEELDVSCEACHGPGSSHVAWARAVEAGAPVDAAAHLGLVVRLKDDDGGQWLFEPDAPTARRSPPRTRQTQIDTCARCHSRRAQIHGDYAHGGTIHDTHRVSLLDERLYHTDGQILEEVYVYGSFVQSPMFREGVTCNDCHDAHGLGLIAEGNRLCGRCHRADVFDTPDHHFHEIGTPGSFCVDCHMPATTYMVVDDRRDHSMRVPRPDLTITLGTPNACNGCHDDQPASWCVSELEERFGSARRVGGHYGQMLHRGRIGAPGAAGALRALIADDEAPGIARATAVAELYRYPGPESVETIAAAVSDGDPFVRRAAAMALPSLPPPRRMALAAPLLDDPVRAVRVAAARALAGINPEPPRLAEVMEEVVASDMVEADRPEAHLRIGNLQVARGLPSDAERAYTHALALSPDSIEARVNLADLYRMTGREDRGETLLREAIDLEPDVATPHHALGLLLVRTGRLEEAMTELRHAARLDPDAARFAYVYAVALHSTGQIAEARAVLQSAAARHPHDPAIRAMLDEVGD